MGKRMHVWMTLGGLVLAALLILGSNAMAKDMAGPTDAQPEEVAALQSNSFWTSGWVDLTPGAVETMTHNLRGNPHLYVVRGWQKDTDGGLGINHRYTGGFETGGSFFGTNWQNLTDTSISLFRRPDDHVADQARVRIWVRELPVEPGFLSASLGVGQQVTATLTINNPGPDPLDFELTEVGGSYTPTLSTSLQFREGSRTIQVLAWTAYADLSREYPNTIAAISQFYPDFTITETTTNDPTVLEAALVGKDIFLVPEMEGAGISTIRDIAATWAGVLDSFVRRGGTIVVTDLSKGAAFFEAEATPISAVLTDIIPANTTYVAGSVTGGATYNAAEDRIEWNGTVPGGDSQTITFQVDVDAPLFDGTVIWNVASIEDLTNSIHHWRQVATDIEAPILTDSYKSVTPQAVSPSDTLTFSVVMRNTGSADAVGVTLQDPIPEHATYVADSVTGGATYNASQDRIEWEGTIAAGDSTTVTFQVTADSVTRGLPIINQATISHPWAYTTYEYAAASVLTGADILVVEYDYTGTDVRDTYAGALEANGYTRYDFFPADYVGTPPTTTLRSYAVSIWYGGYSKWGLSSTDQVAVKDYLDSGGRLLLTGQDIAEGMWPRSFLTETLHIDFVQDAPSGDKGVVGISGEIVETISATIDTWDPDVIKPADSLAVPILEYTGVTTGTAGIRFEEGDSRAVFLGFEFEVVEEQAQREELMGRIMGWLYGSKVYLPLVLKAY